MKYILLLSLAVLLAFYAFSAPQEQKEERMPWPAQIYEPELPRITKLEAAVRLYRKSETPYIQQLEETYPKWRVVPIQAKVTAYCPCKICCGSGARGVTASGAFTNDRPYGLAVPREFLHSRIHVPGYLPETAPMVFWPADDTGSALEESWASTPRVFHVDVRFKNHDWARQWGVRYMTVYMLTKP